MFLDCFSRLSVKKYVKWIINISGISIQPTKTSFRLTFTFFLKAVALSNFGIFPKLTICFWIKLLLTFSWKHFQFMYLFLLRFQWFLQYAFSSEFLFIPGKSSWLCNSNTTSQMFFHIAFDDRSSLFHRANQK